jgi:hypothetical protein
MRKRLKNKLRCCAMCKHYKRGHSSRWTPQEAQALAIAELQVLESTRIVPMDIMLAYPDDAAQVGILATREKAELYEGPLDRRGAL